MKVRIMEHYPEKIQAKLELRDNNLQKSARKFNGNRFQLVVEDVKLWRVGVLKISFKGGTPSLHKKIVDVASEWCKHANIKFDFGYSTKTRKYRAWKKNDTSHIRIGFADEGYWSLVGTDSHDPSIVDLGEISMNFEGFDQSLPGDWKATVLHEFGHALGFHHEHATPGFECDFDWPTLYAYLAGSPNFWSKRTVDHNLKQLPARGLSFSKHDPKSIMHYSFDDWMFKTGKSSRCYIKPNNSLSASDKAMAKKAYPFEKGEFESNDSRRKENLKLLITDKDIPPRLKTIHKSHLKFLNTSNEYKKFVKK